MTSTTANAIIEALRALFARYGMPHELVSDNGPQFVAGEFKSFLKMNCIKHTLCPPYHPSTNVLAECRPSRPCSSLVLIRGEFSTGWLMSSSATETHPTPQQTRLLHHCF